MLEQEIDLESLKSELEEFLKTYAKRQISLEPTVFEVADCLEERARNGESEFWELSMLLSKSGKPEHFYPSNDVWVKWQVSYDSNNVSLGLEEFKLESEAMKRGLELQNQGNKGITLTKIINTAAIEMFKMTNEGWV